jgi:hypothetical protein
MISNDDKEKFNEILDSDGNMMSSILNLNTLESLYIDTGKEFNFCLSDFCRLENLERLTIVNLKEINIEQLREVEETLPLKNLKSLVLLKYKGDGNSLLSFLEFKELRTLHISCNNKNLNLIPLLSKFEGISISIERF